MIIRLFLVLLNFLFCDYTNSVTSQNILTRLSDLEIRVDTLNFKGNVNKLAREFLPEGEVWNHEDALTAESSNARISVSFFKPIKIQFLAIQADSNDSYMIFCENQSSTTLLYAAPPLGGRDGLWIRERDLGSPVQCSRLLIRPTMGDGKYSVSWLFVSEKKPADWNHFRRSVPKSVNYLGIAHWTVPRIQALRLGLIFFTLACVTLLTGKVREVALIICLILGFVSWHNAGRFHLTRYFHAHDIFHYYIGSKYSPELGYKLIYRCTLRALEELAVQLPNSTRDLDTNLVVPTHQEISKSSECRERFSSFRWRNFVQDINYFSRYHGNFSSIVLDHGYNASPVWNIVGYSISNLLPASDSTMILISFLDTFLVGLATLVAIWAFGVKPVAIFAVVWGTAQHADYGWTGNAYLRQDWFALSLLGVSLLKLNRLWLGFFLLFFAAGLRIFPGLSLLGITLSWLFNRSFEFKKFLSSGLALATVFCAAELYLFKGFGHTFEFVGNLLKHSQTFSTNVVGTRIIASYSDQSRSAVVKDLTNSDEFALWKKQRLKTLKERKILYIGLNVILVALYFAVVRLGAPLDSVALSALLLTQCISASNYDYIFMALMALLPKQFLGASTSLYFVGLTHVVANYYEGFPFDDIYFGQSVLIYCWSLFLLGAYVTNAWKSESRSLKIYSLLGGKTNSNKDSD